MSAKNSTVHAGFDIGGTWIKFPENVNDLFSLLDELFQNLRRQSGSAIKSAGWIGAALWAANKGNTNP